MKDYVDFQQPQLKIPTPQKSIFDQMTSVRKSGAVSVPQLNSLNSQRGLDLKMVNELQSEMESQVGTVTGASANQFSGLTSQHAFSRKRGSKKKSSSSSA